MSGTRTRTVLELAVVIRREGGGYSTVEAGGEVEASYPLPKKRSKSAANHLLWKGVGREKCVCRMRNCTGTLPTDTTATTDYSTQRPLTYRTDTVRYIKPQV